MHMQDNYVWLLQEKKSGKVAVVDPSEFKPVATVIQDRFVHHLIADCTFSKQACLAISQD